MRQHLLACVIGLCAAGSASAEIVIFDYTAVLDRAVLHAGGNSAEVPSVDVRGFDIQTGSTVRGFIAIDLDTPPYDWRPGGGDAGIYRGSTSNGGSAKFDQSGYTFTSVPDPFMSGMIASANAPHHYFMFETTTFASTSAGYWGETIRLSLNDYDGELLEHGRPPERINFAGADSADFFYYYSPPEGDHYIHVFGTLTSLTPRGIPPVPEPATYAMFGLGLAALGVAARRQQR